MLARPGAIDALFVASARVQEGSPELQLRAQDVFSGLESRSVVEPASPEAVEPARARRGGALVARNSMTVLNVAFNGVTRSFDPADPMQRAIATFERSLVADCHGCHGGPMLSSGLPRGGAI